MKYKGTKDLTSNEQVYIKALIDCNTPYKWIRKLFFKRFKRDVCSVTISKLKKNVLPKHKSGRKHITSDTEDLQIYNYCRQNPFKSWREVARHFNQQGITVSSRTIRRRMNLKFKLKAHLAKIKPKITEKLAKQRLEFAKLYLRKSNQFYRRFIFADEAKINLISNQTARIYVKRLKGEQLDPDKVKGVVKFRGGGSGVNFWLSMSANGPGILQIYNVDGKMNAQQYKYLLENNLQETIDILGIKNPILIHDRDPSHKSKLVENWMREQGFEHILIPGSIKS